MLSAWCFSFDQNRQMTAFSPFLYCLC